MFTLICFLIFMTGSCFGSFLHVCLSRSGWLTGRSRCDACGYTLKFFDLIPIFSYLFLRGKCRKCKAKISLSHFVSEIMMGLSFLCTFICWEKYGCEVGILVLFGLSFMAVAAIQDIIERMIYSVILYGGIITAAITRLLQLYLTGNYAAFIRFLATVFILKMIFLVVAELSGGKIGNGDFDLLVIMYCLCGGYGAFCSLTIACVIGCLIYIPLIIAKKANRNTHIPFAPLLLMGTISYMLL